MDTRFLSTQCFDELDAMSKSVYASYKRLFPRSQPATTFKVGNTRLTFNGPARERMHPIHCALESLQSNGVEL